MNQIEQYLNDIPIQLNICGDDYVLLRSNKNDPKKLRGLLQILDDTCKIQYIGFNDSDIGADCYTISIRNDYNLILKNKKDKWDLLCFHFGSMIEIDVPIDFNKLRAEYPRRPKDSMDIDEPLKMFSIG